MDANFSPKILAQRKRQWNKGVWIRKEPWKCSNLFVCVCQQIVCEDVNKLVNCIWSALCLKHKHTTHLSVCVNLLLLKHISLRSYVSFPWFFTIFPSLFCSPTLTSLNTWLHGDSFPRWLFVFRPGKCCQNDRTFCWSLSSMKYENGRGPPRMCAFCLAGLDTPCHFHRISRRPPTAFPSPARLLRRNSLDFKLLLNEWTILDLPQHLIFHSIIWIHLNPKSVWIYRLICETNSYIFFMLLKWYLPQLKVWNARENACNIYIHKMK